MKFSGMRAFLPLVAVAALFASGCDKAKSALEEAGGFKMLDDTERDALLAEAGWDVAANPALDNFKIHKAFELADNFPGDLGKDVEIPLGVDIPNEGQTIAQNQRSILLLRAKQLKFSDSKTYTRFQIVTVGRFDAEKKAVVIDDAIVGRAMDADQLVSKGNNNQAGKYILVEGKGDKGISFIEGTVKIKKQGGAADGEAVKGTNVFTSSSPFVTETGATGKYFLAMLENSKGTVMSYKSDIASAYAAPGTPASATIDIPYAGALDAYEGQVGEKTAGLGEKPAADVMAKFDQANTAVTDFCTAYGIGECSWKLLTAHLTHVQPVQAKAADPVVPATPDGKDDPAPTAPAEPPTPPAADDTVIQRDPTVTDETQIPQVDLSCTGFYENGGEFVSSQVFNGADFDNAAVKGWRFQGDVRITAEAHFGIFKDPASLGENYPDEYPGYCVLTTGDQYYQMTNKDPLFNPGPDGAGRTSEMWQKVQIPTQAQSIQVRVAFFSQEFPQYVGSNFNDSFFIKFDESPDFIAAGNLNDLAGGTAEAGVADCKTNTTYSATAKCGEWQFVGENEDLYGDLWLISESTQGPSQGGSGKFNCVYGGENGKCYHGMIEPRIICANIPEGDRGQTMTLRMGVSDAGDSFYDSALAVDTVAFSTAACGAGDASRMTPAAEDPESRVNTL